MCSEGNSKRICDAGRRLCTAELRRARSRPRGCRSRMNTGFCALSAVWYTPQGRPLHFGKLRALDHWQNWCTAGSVNRVLYRRRRPSIELLPWRQALHLIPLSLAPTVLTAMDQGISEELDVSLMDRWSWVSTSTVLARRYVRWILSACISLILWMTVQPGASHQVQTKDA